MPSAATIRSQVEAALAGRIPSALRVVPRELRSVESTGIPSVDEMLDGGLPLGAINASSRLQCTSYLSSNGLQLNRYYVEGFQLKRNVVWTGKLGIFYRTLAADFPYLKCLNYSGREFQCPN